MDLTQLMAVKCYGNEPVPIHNIRLENTVFLEFIAKQFDSNISGSKTQSSNKQLPYSYAGVQQMTYSSAGVQQLPYSSAGVQQLPYSSAGYNL